MEPLALGRRQVPVDRGAQDRVGEAHGAARLEDPRGHQRRHRRLQLGAGQPSQPPGVAHQRPVAQDADRPGQRGGRRRLAREPQQHRIGDAARDELGHVALGGGGRGQAARRRLIQQLTEQERVAPGHLQTGGDEARMGFGAQTVGDERPDRRAGEGRGAEHLGGRIGGQRRRHRGVPGIQRAGGEDERQRLALQAARDERQRARRGPVDPLQVVDDQHQRRVGGEVGRQPVEAVLPGVRGVARGRSGRRRRGRYPGETSAASAAAPASQRSRSSTAASVTNRSNNWRATP